MRVFTTHARARAREFLPVAARDMDQEAVENVTLPDRFVRQNRVESRKNFGGVYPFSVDEILIVLQIKTSCRIMRYVSNGVLNSFLKYFWRFMANRRERKKERNVSIGGIDSRVSTDTITNNIVV